MGLYLLARYMHIYPHLFSFSSKHYDAFMWAVLVVILTFFSMTSTVVLGKFPANLFVATMTLIGKKKGYI